MKTLSLLLCLLLTLHTAQAENKGSGAPPKGKPEKTLQTEKQKDGKPDEKAKEQAEKERAKEKAAKEQTERQQKSQQKQEQAKKGTFTPAEREAIAAHYAEWLKQGGDNTRLPPGLAKKEKLPPGLAKQGKIPEGWQKKANPGDTLPENILKEGSPLPEVLRKKLPAPPADSADILLEGRVMRIHKATREILDAFELKPQ